MIGQALVPLLTEAGHEVGGTTRSPGRAEMLRELGAEPFVVDVYDAEELCEAVAGYGPDLVMHQLTDLPDEIERIAEHGDANSRIRTEGTANLLAAARAAEATRFLAQSIAWKLPEHRQGAIDQHEAMVLGAGGVVLRYGQFYGPGTYHEGSPGDPPRIHVEEAARRTAELLEAPSGIVEIVE